MFITMQKKFFLSCFLMNKNKKEKQMTRLTQFPYRSSLCWDFTIFQLTF